MSSQLESRLNKLEQVVAGGDPCPVCHGRPAIPIRLYEVEPDGQRFELLPEGGGRRPAEDKPPPPCPACARAPTSPPGQINTIDVIFPPEKPPETTREAML